MKKLICFLLAFLCLFELCGCIFFEDTEMRGLDAYLSEIKKRQGKRWPGIANPEYLLPSLSFLEDYDYTDGGFYWYDGNTGYEGALPEVVVLDLKYEKDVYIEAKRETLEKIEPYDGKYYYYNEYVFYENPHYSNRWEYRRFPADFTMVCYNDANCTLLFLGLYIYSWGKPIKKEHFYDIENNWESFVDEYFGEYYDFSK